MRPTRFPLLATILLALAAPALSAPASADSVRPPKPSGHVEVRAPNLIAAGLRPLVKVRVSEMADASGAKGRIRVRLLERDGTRIWRAGSEYRGRQVSFRLPRLDDAGEYLVVVRFRAWKESGTPGGGARHPIRVYQPRK